MFSWNAWLSLRWLLSWNQLQLELQSANSTCPCPAPSASDNDILDLSLLLARLWCFLFVPHHYCLHVRFSRVFTILLYIPIYSHCACIPPLLIRLNNVSIAFCSTMFNIFHFLGYFWQAADVGYTHQQLGIWHSHTRSWSQCSACWGFIYKAFFAVALGGQ